MPKNKPKTKLYYLKKSVCKYLSGMILCVFNVQRFKSIGMVSSETSSCSAFFSQSMSVFVIVFNRTHTDKYRLKASKYRVNKIFIVF